ncbi:MAG: hypothetical protein FJW34_01760 [Acidobacteria bacterium]|nr:hypothetical protein [Acidobacteriota bacterium]
MPSDFPRSPKILKGALVVFETAAPVPTNLIVFQYNPDQVTRSFQRAAPRNPQQGAGDTQNAQPPVESYQLAVELDAADQLEIKDPLAGTVGLHPTLAALELLIYPPSTQLILGRALSMAGTALVTPASAPLVLLVWGPLRVLPVFVASVGIVEQAFDTRLNPIRARVSLSLRVLTEPELRRAGPPFDMLGLVNQIAKEVLARSSIFSSAQQIGASLSF